MKTLKSIFNIDEYFLSLEVSPLDCVRDVFVLNACESLELTINSLLNIIEYVIKKWMVCLDNVSAVSECCEIKNF